MTGRVQSVSPKLVGGLALLLVLALLGGGCRSDAPATAPCSPEAFLPVLKEALDNEAEELTIVRADVERCRNDYAQVYAVPDQSVCEPGVQHCYETEQLFLKWVDGEWQIATAGTGISCDDGSVRDDVCRALGYA